MKICKDCMHSLPDPNFYANAAYCRAPQNIIHYKAVTDIVSGSVKPAFSRPRVDDCGIHRCAGWLTTRIDDLCGKEARWFEPKE